MGFFSKSSAVSKQHKKTVKRALKGGGPIRPTRADLRRRESEKTVRRHSGKGE